MTKSKDALGSRMKEQYESRAKLLLPRRTYTIIRIDGKAFHTYTRKMRRPYDLGLIRAMDDAAIGLCKEIQGAQFAYLQSDEISVLVTDFDKDTTQAWFNGSVQKIASVAASIVTARFNEFMDRILLGQIADTPHMTIPPEPLGLAYFDARAFTIPDPIEVENYFVWRQKDWERNSIAMLARSEYSHRDMKHKKKSELHEMLHLKGKNWAKMPNFFKRGRIIVYSQNFEADTPSWQLNNEIPVFTKERNYLRMLIPTPEEWKWTN